MKKNRGAAVLLLVSLLAALTWLMTFQGSLKVSAETGAGLPGEIGESISEGLDDLKEDVEEARDRINGVPEKTENEGRGEMETDPGVVKDEGDKEMTEKEKDRAAGWIAAAVVVAAAAIALVIALVPKRRKK